MRLIKGILPYLAVGIIGLGFSGCQDIETTREFGSLRSRVETLERTNREKDKILADNNNIAKGADMVKQAKNYLEQGNLWEASNSLGDAKTNYVSAGTDFPVEYSLLRDSIAMVLFKGEFQDSCFSIDKNLRDGNLCKAHKTYLFINFFSQFHHNREDYSFFWDKVGEYWDGKIRSLDHESILCESKEALAQGDTLSAYYYLRGAEDRATRKGARFNDTLEYQALKNSLSNFNPEN